MAHPYFLWCMPELPEVETVRIGLERHLSGERILRRGIEEKKSKISFPKDFTSNLKGRVVDSVERRAKYQAIRLEGGLTPVVTSG